MVYRAIGIMSGSSLDGLDIAFVEFQEQGGKWSFEIKEVDCYAYAEEWKNRLQNAIHLPASDYQLLHTAYGHYIGEKVNAFIKEKNIEYKVSLVASHGHTTFHIPAQKMTAQLGDGAAIAAVTGLPVVSDLRAMDVALGGQGAPIVPMGEKMLLGEYDYFLNLGGIANISFNKEAYTAFDICPANRVLNMLMNEVGKEYDEGGQMAATGSINNELLNNLNQLAFYDLPFPKSLANDFGTDVVYPIIKSANISIADALRTYTEHIALQIYNTLKASNSGQVFVTGGGAHNKFLIERCSHLLSEKNISIVVPDAMLINNKEALIMAFLGVLRWREENTILSSVTGASRSSIGGALWMGQEA
jgi:anhydro-N-acetylmuramic acid kinase